MTTRGWGSDVQDSEGVTTGELGARRSGDLAGLVSRTDLMTVFQILQESRSAALGKPAGEPPLQR